MITNFFYHIEIEKDNSYILYNFDGTNIGGIEEDHID